MPAMGFLPPFVFNACPTSLRQGSANVGKSDRNTHRLATSLQGHKPLQVPHSSHLLTAHPKRDAFPYCLPLPHSRCWHTKSPPQAPMVRRHNPLGKGCCTTLKDYSPCQSCSLYLRTRLFAVPYSSHICCLQHRYRE